LDTVLSLYNSDVADGSDPYDPLGHRLLVQSEAAAAGSQVIAPVERQLAAGDYYVAISGAGNRMFNPFIAGSGYPGRTGDFRLLVSATDLHLAPADLPRVLAIDAAPGPVGAGVDIFDRSPLLIRVDLSGVVDPSAMIVSVTDIAVPSENLAAGVAFSSVANELRLSLAK